LRKLAKARKLAAKRKKRAIRRKARKRRIARKARPIVIKRLADLIEVARAKKEAQTEEFLEGFDTPSEEN
jgi:hypothetical protein